MFAELDALEPYDTPDLREIRQARLAAAEEAAAAPEKMPIRSRKGRPGVIPCTPVHICARFSG
ncbi:MAG: hypothetical protein EA405_15640 [Rhodospirillales bacterium]|nr:MAG: hypothetical protein EA405_15640 [Rhodospirillales bacterium]